MNEETSNKLQKILDENKESQEILCSSVIENQKIKEEAENSSYKKAFEYSIRILTQRDYSTHKMKQKLRERKYDKDDINEVIEKLLEMNYLRDEEFARMRSKQLIFRGYSNSYITRKLEQEFLVPDTEVMDAIRSECNMESDQKLKEIIEKKLQFTEIPTEFNQKMKLKDKVMRACISKGFSYGDITNLMNEYFK